MEKMVLAVFKYFNYLPSCQKSEKTNEQFLRKMQNGQTGRRKENRDFIGPSVERSKKTCFKQFLLVFKTF